MPAATPQQRAERALRALFDDFAARLEREMPETASTLVIYNLITNTFHGAAGNALGKQAKIDHARAAKAYLRRNPDAVAVSDPYVHTLDYLALPGYRAHTTESQPLEEEVRIGLYHEVAHHSNSDSFLPSGPTKESYAQLSALIRLAGGNLDKSAAVSSWNRAEDIIFSGLTSHCETHAVEALRDMARRNDLSRLDADGVESLAFRLALKYAPSLQNAHKIADAFAPVRDMDEKGAPLEDMLAKIGEIMLGSHGKQAQDIYKTGRAFLMPLLAGKTEITAPVMDKKYGEKVDFNAPSWNKILLAISGRDKKISMDAAAQKAHDMRMLGRFDEAVAGQKRLGPEAYAKNLSALIETEKEYAAKLRQVPSSSPAMAMNP